MKRKNEVYNPNFQTYSFYDHRMYDWMYVCVTPYTDTPLQYAVFYLLEMKEIRTVKFSYRL